MDGFVVSGKPGELPGTPERPRVSPGLAWPGLLGTVPGLPDPAPMLPLPPGLAGAPAPPRPPAPAAWAKARVETRQSIGKDIVNVFVNFRNMGCLPYAK